jgi:hypothetical protein
MSSPAESGITQQRLLARSVQADEYEIHVSLIRHFERLHENAGAHVVDMLRALKVDDDAFLRVFLELLKNSGAHLRRGLLIDVALDLHDTLSFLEANSNKD